MSFTEYLGSPDGCYRPISRRHIHPIDAVYTGDVYFGSGTGDCFAVGSASDWGTPLYATGPEIPAGEFAALDEVRPN